MAAVLGVMLLPPGAATGVFLLASLVHWCLPLGQRPGLIGRHYVRLSRYLHRLATAAGLEGAASCAHPGEASAGDAPA